MSLTNSQYDQLMRSYSLRQSENERALRERRETAYTALPELATLDEQAASFAVESARAHFRQDEEQAARLKEQIRDIARKRALLLEKGGFPEDYLSMQYQCPDCQDTGYIGRERCHCFWQKAVELFYTQSDLGRILETENFSTFRLDYYPDTGRDPVTGRTPRENMKNCLQAVSGFIGSFTHEETPERTETQNLLLYGGTGLGKTFLSHCIAKALMDRAFSVIYYSAFDLFESMADETFGRQNRQEERDPALDYLYTCDLLIIDDLGTEMTNSFVASSLFQLLNERILRRRSTLISTNLSVAAFADTYTERVFSRITSSFTLLGLYGEDIRVKKALEKAAGR